MKHLSWLAVASVVLMAASCAPNVYNSGTPASYDVTDFNGDWQIVNDRSDDGRDWLSESNRLGVDDWGTTTTNERIRYRAWFLPDEFRIRGQRDVLRMEDASGVVIAEIPMDESRYEGDDRDYGDRGPRARWIGNDRIEVERQGRNRRIRQTFILEDRGRRLVVGTRVERDGGTRSFTRVYDRS